MPTFISPAGNPEVWDERPAGYVAPEEWDYSPPPQPEPDPPTPIEALRMRIENLDKATERAILAGFDYAPHGRVLRFSYDMADQQNFTHQYNAFGLLEKGVQGIPATTVWNGWEILRDTNGRPAQRILHRVELTATEFVALYMAGLAHVAMRREAGSRQKVPLIAQMNALIDDEPAQ